jgi:hypothetical protein
MAKKILYLLGAGASHAEVMTTASDSTADKYGILISHVSARVMERTFQTKKLWSRKPLSTIKSKKSDFNIELLISLLETNRIKESVVKELKDFVEDDIQKILSTNRKNKFFLHKALFELHKNIEEREYLLGLVSLNYDSVADEAYLQVFGHQPNYFRKYEPDDGGKPLLKLHGSFDWEIPIMPIGMNKNYLFPPYNFIWSKAYDLLTRCDILRIIGCSLNQNDLGLVDLLFKAQINRDKPLEIQLIDFEPTGEKIKSSYGFLSGLLKPSEFEDHMLAVEAIMKGSGNPFKIWLREKANKMLSEEERNRTKYLKKCF